MQTSRIEKQHLGAFFTRYYVRGFRYNPEVSVVKEFNRLCRELSLDDERNGRHLARTGLRRAYVDQFNSNYGTNADDLVAWQELRRDIEIPAYDTLEDCRWVCSDLIRCITISSSFQAIKNTYVNLVDLVDACSLEHFATEKDLSKYSLATGRIFPRKDVPRGSLLEMLLRNILNPGTGLGYQGGYRGGRGNHR